MYSYVFIITGEVTTLEPVYGPPFADQGALSLGETSRVLMVLPPLKWVSMSYIPQIPQNQGSYCYILHTGSL